MRLDVCLIITALLLPVGCATTVVRPDPPPTGELQAINPTYESQQGAIVVERCARRMQNAVRQLVDLRQMGRQSSVLSFRSQAAVEWVYSDFLACRKTLREVADRHTTALGRWASNEQIRADALLVSTFLDNELMTNTLNQSFYRGGIERNTFDEIVFETTSPRVIQRLESASISLVSTESTYATHAAVAASDAKQLVEQIVDRRSQVLPGTLNRIWHTPPTQAAIASHRVMKEQVVRGRALVMENVARMKNPMKRPLTLSDDQKSHIRSQLVPGDILLTYSAGFASNLFLPGNFKHAITYVGTPAERERMGITPRRAAMFAEPLRSHLDVTLRRETLENGEPADVIEALAEGVIFYSLDGVLETRINRLVVLRPRLTPQDRVRQLIDVFSFVGDDYDFFFDFADASDQVCTEVVYRSLQGRGGIDFALARRAGHVTLSADDIVRYHQRRPEHFDCILVVDEDERSRGRAKIRSQASADLHLAKLMGSSM